MKHIPLPKIYFLPILIGLLVLQSCSKDDDVDPYAENYIGPGSQSTEYLSAETYKSLVVDVIYEPGAMADSSAMEAFETFLKTYLNKPNGIVINQKEIEDQSENSLRDSEIEKIEEKYRGKYNNEDTMTAYIYFANSKYTDDTKTSKKLGLAYTATSIIIFQNTIQDVSATDTSARAKYQESILKHEFGHLLGLVDVGSPMVNDHEDPNNEYHCDNKACVMYHAIETDGSMANIPLSLDANCIADLRGNGGK